MLPDSKHWENQEPRCYHFPAQVSGYWKERAAPRRRRRKRRSALGTVLSRVDLRKLRKSARERDQLTESTYPGGAVAVRCPCLPAGAREQLAREGGNELRKGRGVASSGLVVGRPKIEIREPAATFPNLSLVSFS